MTALRGAEGCGRAAGPLEEFIDQIIDFGGKSIGQGRVIIGSIAADINSASGRLDRSAFFGGCQSQIDGSILLGTINIVNGIRSGFFHLHGQGRIGVVSADGEIIGTERHAQFGQIGRIRHVVDQVHRLASNREDHISTAALAAFGKCIKNIFVTKN